MAQEENNWTTAQECLNDEKVFHDFCKKVLIGILRDRKIMDPIIHEVMKSHPIN